MSLYGPDQVGRVARLGEVMVEAHLRADHALAMSSGRRYSANRPLQVSAESDARA